MEKTEKIKKIVFTGGPCSGKTTGLSYVQEKLADYGFQAFVVPEVATDIIKSGFHLQKGISPENFQKSIMMNILERENRWEETAKYFPNQKKVLLCDRGAMDGMAYIAPEIFIELVRDIGYGIVDLRDGRYDGGIIHLRTAALGAEKFYTLINNSARKETIEEARALDEKTLLAWNGHPKLRVIDNGTDFAGKMRRTLQTICRFLEIPVPLEIERKYLIRRMKPKDLPVAYQEIEIEQHYLKSDSEEEMRLRKRGQNEHFVYYLTSKRQSKPGVRIETERMISRKEFDILLKLKDPNFNPIIKKRYCFIWENQYFELDIIEREPMNFHLLEIELTEEQDSVKIPPFIKVLEDVTTKKDFSNYELARR